MKRALAILALSAAVALGQNPAATSPKAVCKDAVEIRREPDGVTFRCSDGVKKIYYREMTYDQQRFYGCDLAQADAYTRGVTAEVQVQNRGTEEANEQRRKAQRKVRLQNQLIQLQQAEQVLVQQIRQLEQQATSAPQAPPGESEARLLRAGDEESMSLAAKQQQYVDRIAYYNGLRQAAVREGRHASDIVPPKWGEADWYPLGRGDEGGGEMSREALLSQVSYQESRLQAVRNEMERVKQALGQ